MKPVLKTILISFIFSAAGMCWFLFVFFKLHGDVRWSWLGVLMGYLSVFTLIKLYCKNTYHTILTKVLMKVVVISFSFVVLGISVGLLYELIGTWNVSFMANYWFVVLILYITNIISLVILVIVYRNTQQYTMLYRILMLLTILLTVMPVFYPLSIAFLGNGINASARW